MKLNGATYMDIHKIGGGIGFTTSKVKESSLQDLEQGLLKNLGKMIQLGTTTVEVKSGYYFIFLYTLINTQVMVLTLKMK